MIKHTGGCHCGKVTFSTEFDPLVVFQCNCKRCRKLFGTVAVFVAFGSKDEVQFNGEMSEYAAPAESGSLARTFFCSDCGTKIYGTADAFEGFGVMLGAFDDPHQFEPKLENYIEHKLPWLKDSGCIKESVEGLAAIETIEAMMENVEQRE